jgi:lipoprotein signal peptidase
MISGIFLVIAILLGYGTTVTLFAAATFGITSISRDLVEKEFRIREAYKWLQDGLWLPCTMAGGFVASLAGRQLSRWTVGGALVIVLVVVLWINLWERRQRGIAHQLAMTLITGGGVFLGVALRLHGAQ